MAVVAQHALGQTGLSVSLLGLGTVKWGRNQQVKYPEPFELPSDDTVRALLACGAECGVNLLDTAPAYGCSEQRIGALLEAQRPRWVLCSKAGETFADGDSSYDFRDASLRCSIKQSLQRLHTDYIDILLIHSDGNDQAIVEAYDVFGTLAELKRHGDILSYGMSTKTVAGGLLTVAHADVVMVTYHPGDTEQLPVLEAAAAANKGVLIKKALASGHIERLRDVHSSTLEQRPDSAGAGPLLTDQQSKGAASDHSASDDESPVGLSGAEQRANGAQPLNKASGYEPLGAAGPVAEAFAFIRRAPAVSSIVVGTLSTQHLRANASWCSEEDTD